MCTPVGPYRVKELGKLGDEVPPGSVHHLLAEAAVRRGGDRRARYGE